MCSDNQWELRTVPAGEVSVSGEMDSSGRWQMYVGGNISARGKCRCEGGWVDESWDLDRVIRRGVKHEIVIGPGFVVYFFGVDGLLASMSCLAGVRPLC
jgi:hypothetical protein